MRRNARISNDPDALGAANLNDIQLNEIDRAVGGQIRYQRILLGLSQQNVSGQLGLTFQQLQKYEHGTNRVSASRLVHLSLILRVPVSFFFETVRVASDTQSHPHEEILPQAEEILPRVPDSMMSKPEALALIKAFYGITSPKERTAAFRLISAMGGRTTSA